MFNLLRFMYLTTKGNSLILQCFLQTEMQSIVNRLHSSVRYIFIEQKFFSILTMLLLNIVMLFSGVIENVSELGTLLTEWILSEFFLVNIFSFLADPELSGQMLIGFCWLIFVFFTTRRIAIVLQKSDFVFCETLQSFVGLNSHGSRAPPQVNG